MHDSSIVTSALKVLSPITAFVMGTVTNQNFSYLNNLQCASFHPTTNVIAV